MARCASPWPACAPATGSERGACYPNGTCDQGLRCLSDRCVRSGSDGGVDDVAPTDAPSAGDVSTVTDVVGRSVQVKKPVELMILSQIDFSHSAGPNFGANFVTSVFFTCQHVFENLNLL